MKTFNITPGHRYGPLDKRSKEVDLLEFNMSKGSQLKFDEPPKDEIFFRVNVNFKNHRMSKILCLN